MDYQAVDGTVLHTTEKAALVEVDLGRGRTKEVWIPRSLIQDGEAVEAFDTDLLVAEWFCEKEGI